jgi:hypothetical protein
MLALGSHGLSFNLKKKKKQSYLLLPFPHKKMMTECWVWKWGWSLGLMMEMDWDNEGCRGLLRMQPFEEKVWGGLWRVTGGVESRPTNVIAENEARNWGVFTQWRSCIHLIQFCWIGGQMALLRNCFETYQVQLEVWGHFSELRSVWSVIWRKLLVYTCHLASCCFRAEIPRFRNLIEQDILKIISLMVGLQPCIIFNKDQILI